MPKNLRRLKNTLGNAKNPSKKSLKQPNQKKLMIEELIRCQEAIAALSKRLTNLECQLREKPKEGPRGQKMPVDEGVLEALRKLAEQQKFWTLPDAAGKPIEIYPQTETIGTIICMSVHSDGICNCRPSAVIPMVVGPRRLLSYDGVTVSSEITSSVSEKKNF